MAVDADQLEFLDEEDDALDPKQVARFKEAVLYSMDWTVETVLNQLSQGHIELNPRFQRRDAWGITRKSQFVESIFLGLPIPQIVLAERKNERGNFIVLDGKQRLLTLLQFTGNAVDSENNAFSLRGLEALKSLTRKKFKNLKEGEDSEILTTFFNHTIRTVVIRNWPSTSFLHTVFLRLNTGSLKLSPQELRQALLPGEFSDFADDAAADSKSLQSLMSLDSPDPRMRDVELLVRHLAFANFLSEYGGRMKVFLDDSCKTLNKEWDERKRALQRQVRSFNDGLDALIKIFGVEKIARKAESRSFNRAIFDALIFYASNSAIRTAMLSNRAKVRTAYTKILGDEEFLEAIESDTAGIPHTGARLIKWGEALSAATRLEFSIPEINRNKIRFAGF